MIKEATHLKIWCDGGMQKNPGMGGYGVYGKFTNANTNKTVGRFKTSGGKLRSTNIEMEVLAMLAALNIAVNNPDVPNVTIYSDSLWTINVMTGEWRVREKHEDKIKILNLFWKQAGKERVRIKWVRGHSGVYGNEVADELATEAVQRMIRTRTEFGMWKQLLG